MPEITVILPSLNVVRYIGTCLQSVERQTFTDFEIVCVDSGSTDGTLDVIRQHMALDKRIRLIMADKKSFGYQMNRGIESAKGNYIAFVETDDYILEGMLEKLYNIIQNHDVDAVKADFDNVVELSENQIWSQREGFHYSDDQYYDTEISVAEHTELYAKEYLYWRGLYRKNFLLNYGIRFNESAGASNQDIGFFYQTYLYADKMYFLRDSFYRYRRNRPDASLFDDKALVKLMGEYQYIETVVRKGSERQADLETYYYYRMFRQVYLRIRLAALSEICTEETLRAVWYFKGLLENALGNGKIDEALFGNANYTELLMLLENPEGYIEHHRLICKAQHRRMAMFIQKINGYRDVIIFGRCSMGGFCNCVVVSHGLNHVKAFCDNNKALHGSSYMGTTVISPEMAVREYGNAVYVLAGGSHNLAMRTQLLSLGVLQEDIIDYQFGKDWLYLNEDLF